MSNRAGRRSAALAIVIAALPAGIHGCSTPTAPPPPPGGGQELVLSFEQFELAVAPVLTRHGCDAGGDCHGGGIRGSYELSPPGDKDVLFDFEQSSLQVSAATPGSSPLLTEPLALGAGGTPHGVKPFAAVSDSDYVVIEQWILAGERR